MILVYIFFRIIHKNDTKTRFRMILDILKIRMIPEKRDIRIIHRIVINE